MNVSKKQKLYIKVVLVQSIQVCTYGHCAIKQERKNTRRCVR